MIPNDELVRVPEPVPLPFRLIGAIFQLIGAILLTLFDLIVAIPPVRRFAEGPAGKRVKGVIRGVPRFLAGVMICVIVVWFAITLVGIAWRMLFG